MIKFGRKHRRRLS